MAERRPPMGPGEDERPEPTLHSATKRLQAHPLASLADGASSDALHPITLFAQNSGHVRILWRRGGRAVLGVGAVAHFTAAGATRLHHIKQGVSEAAHHLESKRAPGVTPAAGPFFMGGYAFRDAAPSEPWTGWPSACFVLPAKQWVWSDEGVFETTITGAAPLSGGPMSDHGGAGTPASPAAASSAGTQRGNPSTPPTGGMAPVGPRPPMDPPRWAKAVDGVLASIGAGRVDKVVLARAAQAPATDATALLRKLWPQANVAQYAIDLAALGTTQTTGTSTNASQAGDAAAGAIPGGTWLGASPEFLCRVGSIRVESHALAGSATDAAGLDSPKIKREHDFVVDEIKLGLSDLGIRLEKGEPSRPLAVGGLVHLETPIMGRAQRGLHVLDVAGALHPTPAVEGSPRQGAARLRERHETTERGWYAGGLGWFDALGQGEMIVALRGALVQPTTTTLFAGAGIVEGSKAQAEWEETERKMQPMRDALGIAAPPAPPATAFVVASTSGPARPPGRGF